MDTGWVLNQSKRPSLLNYKHDLDLVVGDQVPYKKELDLTWINPTLHHCIVWRTINSTLCDGTMDESKCPDNKHLLSSIRLLYMDNTDKSLYIGSCILITDHQNYSWPALPPLTSSPKHMPEVEVPHSRSACACAVYSRKIGNNQGNPTYINHGKSIQ